MVTIFSKSKQKTFFDSFLQLNILGGLAKYFPTDESGDILWNKADNIDLPRGDVDLMSEGCLAYHKNVQVTTSLFIDETDELLVNNNESQLVDHVLIPGWFVCLF